MRGAKRKGKPKQKANEFSELILLDKKKIYNIRIV